MKYKISIPYKFEHTAWLWTNDFWDDFPSKNDICEFYKYCPEILKSIECVYSDDRIYKVYCYEITEENITVIEFINYNGEFFEAYCIEYK